MLRIKNFLGKPSHLSHTFIIKVSQAPSVTERAKGDGNCFCYYYYYYYYFCPIALAVTGSQQDDGESHLIAPQT